METWLGWDRRNDFVSMMERWTADWKHIIPVTKMPERYWFTVCRLLEKRRFQGFTVKRNGIADLGRQFVPANQLFDQILASKMFQHLACSLRHLFVLLTCIYGNTNKLK